MQTHLRALKKGDKKAGHVERNCVEQHDTTEPLVQLGWKDACGRVSLQHEDYMTGFTYANKSKVSRLSSML